MLAAHVPAEAVAAPPERAAGSAGRRAVAHDGDSARPGATLAAAAAPRGRRRPRHGAGSRCGRSTGPSAGEVIALERANTMIGTPGGDTALVVKRGQATLPRAPRRAMAGCG